MGGRVSGLVFRTALAAMFVTCLGYQSAKADSAPCAFAGQQRMLMVQLFMGLDMPGDATVSAKQWNAFLAAVVTPRFPDGFTVYDGYGQWWNPQTRSIGKEDSKVIAIAMTDSDSARANISDVSAAYRKQFHQVSVGIVSNLVCASF